MERAGRKEEAGILFRSFKGSRGPNIKEARGWFVPQGARVLVRCADGLLRGRSDDRDSSCLDSLSFSLSNTSPYPNLFFSSSLLVAASLSLHHCLSLPVSL